MFYQTYEDIVNIIEMPKEQKPLRKDTLESIEDTLNDPGTVIVTEPQLEPVEMSYDYMSGIWKMMEVECEGKEFTVSPMDFNVYNQKEPHWLQRPSFPQETLDESKARCHKWLSEQHT